MLPRLSLIIAHPASFSYLTFSQFSSVSSPTFSHCCFSSSSAFVSRLLLQIYITPSFVSNCDRMSSHLPSPAWVLKLYSNYYSLLIRLWGWEVKRWDRRKETTGKRMNNWNVLFIAAFHHSQRCWNYLGEMTTNCVRLLTLSAQLRCTFARCVWVYFCVHMWGLNSSLTI